MTGTHQTLKCDECTVPLIKVVKHILHPKMFTVNILVCYKDMSNGQKKLVPLNCGGGYRWPTD